MLQFAGLPSSTSSRIAVTRSVCVSRVSWSECRAVLSGYNLREAEASCDTAIPSFIHKRLPSLTGAE
jgi:hypothetical protein